MPSDPLTITAADPTVVGPLFTTQEVARLLRVSQRTVQDWIREGALPAIRYGRIIRIRQADLVAFGEGVRQRPPPGEAQE
jgi:excisionase family DNA binding protein